MATQKSSPIIIPNVYCAKPLSENLTCLHNSAFEINTLSKKCVLHKRIF